MIIQLLLDSLKQVELEDSTTTNRMVLKGIHKLPTEFKDIKKQVTFKKLLRHDRKDN